MEISTVRNIQLIVWKFHKETMNFEGEKDFVDDSN